jgi:hypothetical protein
MATEILCLSCSYRRTTERPVPSCTVDPTNLKRMRWQNEWRDIVARREVEERERAGLGKAFPDVPPWFFAWCERKSAETSQRQDRPQFVLAEEWYRKFHVGCAYYEPATDAGTEKK